MRAKIDHATVLKYSSVNTSYYGHNLSRFRYVFKCWFVMDCEKTDTASEGSDPERHNARHSHDEQEDVLGVSSCVRYPDSAYWKATCEDGKRKFAYFANLQF